MWKFRRKLIFKQSLIYFTRTKALGFESGGGSVYGKIIIGFKNVT